MFLATSSKSGWLSYWPEECCIGSRAWPCLHFHLWLLSLGLSRSTESFLVAVKGPLWMWTHRGARKISRGWRMAGDPPPAIPECFWQALPHLEMSLDIFLYEKRPTPLMYCSWSQCHLFHSCASRQVAYLFLAPFSYKIRIPIIFSYGLSPFKVGESWERLNWSWWNCKDVKRWEKQWLFTGLFRGKTVPHCVTCIIVTGCHGLSWGH